MLINGWGPQKKGARTSKDSVTGPAPISIISDLKWGHIIANDRSENQKYLWLCDGPKSVRWNLTRETRKSQWTKWFWCSCFNDHCRKAVMEDVARPRQRLLVDHKFRVSLSGIWLLKKCPLIPFPERVLLSRESSALLMPVTPMGRNVSTSCQGPGVEPAEGKEKVELWWLWSSIWNTVRWKIGNPFCAVLNSN